MSSGPRIPKSYPGHLGDVHHHSTNLFDMDERVNDGGLVDEATGERYDNSTQTDEQFFGGDQEARIGHIVSLEDLKGETAGEMDEADAWLAEHDMPDPGYAPEQPVDMPKPRRLHRIEPPHETPSDRELV